MILNNTWVLKGQYRNHDIRAYDLLNIYLFCVTFYLLSQVLPNILNDSTSTRGIILIGIIGAWRWGWWVVNFARSVYFGKVMFPRMRAKANRVWGEGWRPRHVHFLATTFHEDQNTTYRFLESIVRESRDMNVPCTLWFGLGSKTDEKAIKEWFAAFKGDAPLEVILIHQNQPGKRAAIGLLLRALSRRTVGQDEIVILMDGDSIMTEGATRKCTSLLAAYPNYKALTTDEDVVTVGPEWVNKWLTMRFAQRRMWMQSHAVSNKVITLTGRMSVFRAEPLVDKDFIRTMEADHLDHWFWGSFRFLSGDDKSTWYSLLKSGAEMTFVPDVMVYTIERIEGLGLKRCRDNLLRWSGNMLRNGMRAILLGPRQVGAYIWWCLIDQRIAIWTMLAGICTAISMTLFVRHDFIFTYILWVMFTRFLVSIMMFFYSDRYHISYVPMLYINQLCAAFAKVYIMFRLPMQSWTNRMMQTAGQDLLSRPFMRFFAAYMNSFSIVLLILFVLFFTEILKWPNFLQVF